MSNSLENLEENLKALKNKRNELVKQIKESSKTFFKEAVGTLFEEHPVLVKFAWTQYTPYFNDGDTCEFSSNHSDPGVWFTSTDPKKLDDSPWRHGVDSHPGEEYNYNTRAYKPIPGYVLTPEDKAGKAVVDFLSNFEDDDFLAMFGDHQLVTVTKDGVESEDYDHE